MPYVQPSGIIDLFKGINLDNRYMHTIYFANTTSQTQYFDSKIDYNLRFNAQSYSRPTKQSVKVQKNAEDLIGVTYMRFNNRGNKWYYAFVTSCEYVNEKTSLISYEIDVMQTWFIQNGSIPVCFVERQHASDDTWTKHLEAEPIGSEVYDMTEIEVEGVDNLFANYDWVLQSSNEYQGQGGGKYAGIFAGGSFFHGNDSTSLSTAILNTLGSWDKNQQSADIIDMYMFPHDLVDGSASGGHVAVRVTVPETFDNYTPKNKKLFTYPYSFLYVTTNNADNASYQWEYFDTVTLGSDIEFNIYSCFIGGGEISLSPRMYNGIDDDFDDKLVINNFPKVSWSYDAYQAWTASGGQTKLNFERDIVQRKGMIAIEQNINNAVLDTAKSAVSLIGSADAMLETNDPMKIGAVGNSLLGGVQTVANAYYTNQLQHIGLEEANKKIDFMFKDARYMPDKVVGKASPSIAVGQKFLGYRFFNCHVRKNEAVRIDNFFTMYGYAVNNVERVNLSSRPYWNFVKTKGCQIQGQMPASSKEAIARIFDGGIFFWKNGDNVGNFAVGGIDANGAISNQ